MRHVSSSVYGPCVAIVLEMLCAFSHADGALIPTGHAAQLKHDSTFREVIGRFLAACISPHQNASKRQVATDALVRHRPSNGSIDEVVGLDNWSECCKLRPGSTETETIAVYPTNISGLFLADVELVTHQSAGNAAIAVHVALFEMRGHRITKMTMFFADGSACSIGGK
jgi:hypothetical protein